jgi:hypothetical protein
MKVFYLQFWKPYVQFLLQALLNNKANETIESDNLAKLGVAASSAKLVCSAALLVALEKQGCTKKAKENFNSFLLKVSGKEQKKKLDQDCVNDAATHALFDFKRFGVSQGHCMVHLFC